MSSSMDNLQDLIRQASDKHQVLFLCSPTDCGYGSGRINLIGDHTDYNDGLVFPMAVPLHSVVVGSLSTGDLTTVCTLCSDAASSEPISFHLENLKPGEPSWANYLKGVIANFPTPVKNFNCVIATNIPIGSGLSSSAALEVAVFLFLESLLGVALDMSLTEKAKICQKAEHDFAGVPCGLMDQMAALHGVKGHALLFDCRSLTIETVPVPQDSYVFLVVNSRVKHEHSGGEYVVRRNSCAQVASLLGKTSLRDISMRELESCQNSLPEDLYKIARHVLTENERTQNAAEALKRGDISILGALMTQSHISLRDDYRSSCPEIDELVDICLSCTGVLGSRITGGGFGGCTVTLVLRDHVDSLIQEINRKFGTGDAEIYVFTPADGGNKKKL